MGDVMKNTMSLLEDIQQVHRILMDAHVVKGVVVNQIRLFLNGNEKSHLFDKFALLYPRLWGKYPKLNNAEINNLLNLQSNNPLKLKYASFENFDHAKIYTEQDLENLTDWDKLPTQLEKTKVFCKETIDGRMIPFNSEPEWNTYTKLKAGGFIQSFRAQSLLVPYNSYLKEDRKYFPDFIFLTPEGYIAIVESKPIEFMANFFVQAKYLALRRFCEERGFIYAMVDEHLHPYHQMKLEKETNKVTEYFDHLLETARMFDDDGFDLIKAKFKGEWKVSDLEVMIAKHIIRRQLVNTSSGGYHIKGLRKINVPLLLKGPTKRLKPIYENVSANE